MGNLSCNRRNSRIFQNPGPASDGPPPPPRIAPAPPGYIDAHAQPPPPPANYPPHVTYYPYPPYNNGMGGPIPAPQYFPHNVIQSNGQYMMNLPPQQMYRPPPYAPPPVPPPRVVEFAEHQKANTIQNDVNLKRATLRLEKDEKNPGYYLVSFTFDATVAGSICVFFLAKEGVNCSVTPAKPHMYTPLRTKFEKGLGQKFKQDSETGVMLALFDDEELLRGGGEDNVFPLLIRLETVPKSPHLDEPPRDAEPLGAALPEWVHSQITLAVIEKKDDETYEIRVVKQIIWVEGVRYELQEIYGIENSGSGVNFDGTDAGKECVVCLSEPQDTTVLPCRHMCMCSECAKVLRFQTNRCPICRTPVERLLEIKVPKNDVKLNNTTKNDSNDAVESSSSRSRLAPENCPIDENGKITDETDFVKNKTLLMPDSLQNK